MNLEKIHNVYFIGIGGIGMSALARWFNVNGYSVAGYDRTPTSLTDELTGEGVPVHFDDDVRLIPDKFRSKDDTLVVFTPAVPSDHSELNYFRDRNFKICKRSEVLGILTKDLFTVAVAGTHGKTTTSSMIAHVLYASGKNCSAFLGGILKNYNSNILLGRNSNEQAMVVVEADEYDRSFLKLSPDIAVITSVDADHLDIYGDDKEFKKGFNDFIKKIKPSGHLFYRDMAEEDIELNNISTASFGMARGEFSADDIRIENGNFIFNAIGPDMYIKDITLQIPGFHNIENALAAIAVCSRLGVSHAQIKEALEKFEGVKRRFEYIIRKEELIYIDDYAHHPRELEAFLGSVKAMYPAKNMTVIFQPHLFTRTRDFMDEFAESLAIADTLILLDIYPARELPIEGITSEALLAKVKIEDKKLLSNEELFKFLGEEDAEVLVTAGAGDIDKLVDPIKKLLLNEKYA